MELGLKMPKPTQAPCGSVEKIEVLRLRLERGEMLYHPQDCKTILPLPARRGARVSNIREIRIVKKLRKNPE